ncbi:MAG: transcription elongation factor GreA [Eubacterium sp.]|nr:transcription elongation factor GreA [Eubacterium sp.]
MGTKMTMTSDGLKKLEDELEELKVVRRKEVAQKIKEAREQGDLSENAEYDAAKDEQRDIEARITEIEEILKNLDENSIVDADEVDLDKVSVGCSIKILDIEFNEEEEYQLVGSIEASSLKGKISNESPLGKALIGSKVGETVNVETPDGDQIQYKVLEIAKA